jgi:glycosyltransferase involved in cell wall biosynthesis
MFSVILDNYNYARYVGPAIRSVLGQTWRDFELIVVDDGSTDGSRPVIEAFSDPRIVKVFQTNGGQGSAFRAGLDRAQGRWIAFLDSDDLWHPEKLRRCADVLSGDAGISYLAHNYDVTDSDGQIRRSHDMEWPTGYSDPLAGFAACSLKSPLVPTSFFCTAREFARRVVFEPAQWRICADLPFMGGLPVLGRSYVLDEVLGTYRIHHENRFAGRGSERAMADTLAQLYDCASAQLAAGGDPRRFDFRQSAFFQSQEVLSHPAFSPKGLAARIRYRIAKMRGSARFVGRPGRDASPTGKTP